MSKLRADCSRCCGLCCVVPDQLVIQGFGNDKPANIPCLHLAHDHHCAIYERRDSLGYPACASFDCFGAGQWVTEYLFSGADWQESPELAPEMYSAYRHWLPRFHAAALIEAALPYVRGDTRQRLVARIAELTSSEATSDCAPVDERRLRAETMVMIHDALGLDDSDAPAPPQC